MPAPPRTVAVLDGRGTQVKWWSPAHLEVARSLLRSAPGDAAAADSPEAILRPEIIAVVREVAATGASCMLEMAGLGEPSPGSGACSLALMPVPSTGGEIPDVLLLAVGPAEAVQPPTRGALDAAEALVRPTELETIFGAISEALVVYDEHGVPIRANPAARAMFGFDLVGTDRAEVARRLKARHVDGRAVGRDDVPIPRALRGEVVSGEEYVITVPPGRDIVVLASASPIVESSRIVGVAAVMRDISDLKRAQQALRESEERYRHLVDLAPDPIVAIQGHRFAYANASAARMAGAAAPEDLIGRHLLDLVHPDDRELARGRLDSLLRGEKVVPRETRVVNLQGVHLLVEATSGPTVLNGKPAIQVIVRDVTARRKAEEALRAADQRRALFVEQSPLAVIEWDVDARVLAWNPAAELMFGYTAAEAAGRSGPDLLLPPEARPAVEKVWRELLAHRGGARSTNENLTKDGRVITCEWYTAPLVDTDGTAIGGVSLVLDITERRRAEAALRETRDYLESLITYANAPIIVWDNDYRITRFNAAFERLTGRTSGEVVGRELPVLFPADRAAEAMENVRRASTGERWDTVEIPILGAAGDVRTVLWNSATVHAPDHGAVVATIAQGIDITDRKQAEESVRRARAEAVTERMRMQAAMQALPVGMAILDARGGVVLNNAAFERVWGGLPPPVDGVRDYSAFKAWWADGGRPVRPDEWASARVVQTGQAVLGQFLEIGRFDGERAFVLNSAAPVSDADGKLVGCAVAIQDITDRRLFEEALRRTRDYLENLVNYANAPIIVWETDFQITRFNRAFERLTGKRAEDVVRQNLEILFPEDRREEAMAHIRRASAGERWETVEIPIVGAGGDVRTVLWNSATISGPDGVTPIATIAQGHDITERKLVEDRLKASLREKEVLLKEIHHRVKNNLQIIASMLNLQAESIADERDRLPLKESQNRVRTLALIHEKLYGSHDLARIQLREYFHELATFLRRSFLSSTPRVQVHEVIEDIALEIDTSIPLALIVNELMSNAFKHAFPDGRPGTLRLGLRRTPQPGYRLVVADDGVGFPAGIDFRATDSLGLQLVSALTTQLAGTIELDRSRGTRFVVEFPEAK